MLAISETVIGRICVMTCFLFGLLGGALVHIRAEEGPKNLALSARGARAQSWEPGVRVISERERSRVNDGSLHTYWAVRAMDVPVDIEIEWPKAQEISSVVVRYFDGRMLRGPAMARSTAVGTTAILGPRRAEGPRRQSPRSGDFLGPLRVSVTCPPLVCVSCSRSHLTPSLAALLTP
jgi:hypothetical protein